MKRFFANSRHPGGMVFLAAWLAPLGLQAAPTLDVVPLQTLSLVPPSTRLGESVAMGPVGPNQTMMAFVGMPDASGTNHHQGLVLAYQRKGTAWELAYELKPTQAYAGQRFGASLSLSKNRLVVGGPCNGPTQCVGAVWVYPVTESGAGNPFSFTSSFSGSPTNFGTVVVADGDQALISEPSTGTVYRRSLSSFTAPSSVVGQGLPGFFGLALAFSGLTAVVGGPGIVPQTYLDKGTFWQSSPNAIPLPADSSTAQCGTSLALRGDHLAVGCPLASDSGGPNDNAVLFFEQTQPGMWTPRDQIQDTEKANLGQSIAINEAGDRVAALRTVDGKLSVQFLARSGTSWALDGPPVPLGPLDGYQVGSVALHGEDAVVGDPNDSRDSTAVGAAYLLSRASGAWTVVDDKHPLPQESSLLSLSIDGDLIAVGLPEADDAGPSSGRVDLFRRMPGGTWRHETSLTGALTDPPVQTDSNQRFGASVSLQQGVLAVGMPASNDFPGSVALFQPDVNGIWTRTDTVQSPDPSSGDGFGGEVALDGGVLVVGAFSGQGFTAPSQLYSFAVSAGGKATAPPSPPAPPSIGTFFAAQGLDPLHGYHALAMRKGRLVLGLPSDLNTFGGAAYAYQMSGPGEWQPFGPESTKGTPGKYVLPPDPSLKPSPNAPSFFAESVSMDAAGETLLLGSQTISTSQGTGAVWAYERTDAGWKYTQLLLPPDPPGKFLQFGIAHATQSGTSVIASRNDAHLWHKGPTGWAHQKFFAHRDDKVTDTKYASLGPVALDQHTVVVSLPTRGEVTLWREGLAQGGSCTSDSECTSGFCVDGVCCDTACGGGLGPCFACSAAKGATQDGTCTVKQVVCRDKSSDCEMPAVCDAKGVCPDLNPLAVDGTVCQVDGSPGACFTGTCEVGGTGGTGGAGQGGAGVSGASGQSGAGVSGSSGQGGAGQGGAGVSGASGQSGAGLGGAGQGGLGGAGQGGAPAGGKGGQAGAVGLPDLWKGVSAGAGSAGTSGSGGAVGGGTGGLGSRPPAAQLPEVAPSDPTDCSVRPVSRAPAGQAWGLLAVAALAMVRRRSR